MQRQEEQRTNTRVLLKIKHSSRVLRSLASLYFISLFLCIVLFFFDFVSFKVSLSITVFIFPVAVVLWTLTVGVSVAAAIVCLLATLPWSLRSVLAFLSYAQAPSPAHPATFTCPLPLPEKLDAVISWVNVTDVAWQERARAHECPVEKYLSGAGDADPFETLRYSVRAIRKHLKFVDKIYITTEDQNVAWLDEDDSVRILPHAAIMDPGVAPVFNSQPTEYSVHRLFEKDLTNYPCILYLNDDFLVMKDLDISDLINPDTGRAIFYGYQHKSISFGPTSFVDLPVGLFEFPTRGQVEQSTREEIIDPHVPYLVNYHAMKDALAKCGADCDEIFKNRCRRSGRFWAEFYFDHMLLHNSLEYVSPLDALTNRFGLGLNFMDLQRNVDMINLIDPKFVFIESHDSLENRPGAIEIIRQFLSSHFPEAGSWELNKSSCLFCVLYIQFIVVLKV